jgi:hypothetical protein
LNITSDNGRSKGFVREMERKSVSEKLAGQ